MDQPRPWILVVGIIVGAVVGTAQAQEDARPVIAARAELPRQSYPVTALASELFVDPAAFRQLAEAVEGDVHGMLESYSITDRTLLKDLHQALADCALVLGEHDMALAELDRVAELEEKPAARLLSGLLARCSISVYEQRESEARHDAFRVCLSDALGEMPWDVIQEDVTALRTRIEIFSERFILGLIQSQIEPGVEQAGHLSGDTARQLIAWRAMVVAILPYQRDITSVLGDLIEHNRVEKPDIWAERCIDLNGAGDLHPVVIGIWDSGVDPSVFGEQMWRNDGETIDGVDTDGNGFVDDVHGIATSWLGERITGPLSPLNDDQRARLPELTRRIKGLMDMRAGISSHEASETRRLLSELNPEQVGTFMEEFWLYFNFVHGTAVAGIAVEGNPAARVLIARFEFPNMVLPPPLFEEHARAHAEDFRATVGYFRAAGVRVVNMSWAYAPSLFEKSWEAHGIGGSAEERAERSRALFAIVKQGMVDAIDSAPDILFVVAAGNADSDSSFDQVIPASIDRPNVLTVGAVNRAGEAAGFTSFGQSVDIYANGVEVDCVIPGGGLLTLSGTSQAAPQVANLAGKILARRPSLTASETARLILEGASQSEDGRLLLVHPLRSIELSGN